MKFELKQLNNNIFILSFDDAYDLSMHFLRWSEYTEWADPKIKGQMFTILDFIESYSKQHDNTFSYANDWAGFNIPSRRFEEYPFGYIKDRNKYDDFMEQVVIFIKGTVGEKPFYLIGHVTGEDDVIDHEIAHAIYDRMPKYRAEMKEHTAALSDKHHDLIKNCTKDMGYAEEVLDDELQAYLSTGLSEEHQKLFKNKRIPKNLVEPFIDTFEMYKGILLNGE